MNRTFIIIKLKPPNKGSVLLEYLLNSEVLPVPGKPDHNEEVVLRASWRAAFFPVLQVCKSSDISAFFLGKG